MSGLTRTVLRDLAQSKRDDARLLLDNQRWSGAYYLYGFSVELGLKACVARLIVAETVPDRAFSNSFYTHRLEQLVALAGLKEVRDESLDDPHFKGYWETVQAWSIDSRYQPIDVVAAAAMAQAVDDPEHGIFPMADASLVAPDVAAGRQLITRLRRARFPLVAAAWVDDPDAEKWRLYLVTNVADTQAYFKVAQSALGAKQNREALKEISYRIVSDQDPVGRTLVRWAAGLKQDHRRHSGTSPEGAYISDSIVYRLAA